MMGNVMFFQPRQGKQKNVTPWGVMSALGTDISHKLHLQGGSSGAADTYKVKTYKEFEIWNRCAQTTKA